MKFLRNLDQNAERWLLLVFYVMLVLTMAIEVLRREVFSYSSIWGEEVVRYSFIYLAWVGAAVAVKERVFGSVTDGLRVSRVWALMAVPLGFSLLMLRLVQSFIRDVRYIRDGKPVFEGSTLFD